MSVGQPYIYDRYGCSVLGTQNGFDPKAVSRASQLPPPKPRPKQEGPLLNFNRHPDSYLVLPYGNTNATPMSGSTKDRIKWARHIQLCLRALEMLSTIGVFICVVCIRGATSNEGWILRLPPGVDALTLMYAIYHLIRPSHGRTPASSASYHFFALFMDTGLIPFYVFTAILAKANYEELPGTVGRWRTSFSTDEATHKLLLATLLAAIVAACLHAFSLILDIYLAIVFRKISHLPPDMNPMDEDPKFKRKSKHKHKNSSVSELLDKRMSDMTSSSAGFAPSNRGSHAQEPLIGASSNPRISFFHSRTDQDDSFSPHNPNTARKSQAGLAAPVYRQSGSVRASSANLAAFELPSRVTSAMPSDPRMSKRSSAIPTVPIYEDDIVSDHEDGVMSGEPGAGWAVPGGTDGMAKARDYDPYRPGSDVPPLRVHQQYVSEQSPLAQFEHQPLRMNPPTPETENGDQLGPMESEKESNRTQTMMSHMTASSIYSNDETTLSGTTDPPRTRFYGDLAAAMRGVRQHEVINGPKSMAGSVHNAGSEITNSTYSSRQSPKSRAPPVTSGDRRSRAKNGAVGATEKVGRKQVVVGDQIELSAPYPPRLGDRESPRVISRSGVDLTSAGAEMGFGNGRRGVSGKIAEEGRGGLGNHISKRQSSGRNF